MDNKFATLIVFMTISSRCVSLFGNFPFITLVYEYFLWVKILTYKYKFVLQALMCIALDFKCSSHVCEYTSCLQALAVCNRFIFQPNPPTHTSTLVSPSCTASEVGRNAVIELVVFSKPTYWNGLNRTQCYFNQEQWKPHWLDSTCNTYKLVLPRENRSWILLLCV